jgi:hypothetical protein
VQKSKVWVGFGEGQALPKPLPLVIYTARYSLLIAVSAYGISRARIAAGCLQNIDGGAAGEEKGEEYSMIPK